MFRVQCQELSLSTGTSHSHAYCGYFVVLGSYRTRHLGRRPWHRRMPTVGVRRIHETSWETGSPSTSLHSKLRSSVARSLSSLCRYMTNPPLLEIKTWFDLRLLRIRKRRKYHWLTSLSLVWERCYGTIVYLVRAHFSKRKYFHPYWWPFCSCQVLLSLDLWWSPDHNPLCSDFEFLICVALKIVFVLPGSNYSKSIGLYRSYPPFL